MSPAEKRVRPACGLEMARSQAGDLPGDFRALLRQVGVPGLHGPSWAAAPDAPPDPARFLEDYLSRLLLPCELPAIAAACGHARRNELRELLAQDQALAAPMFSAPFARASRRVGRLQLARLRPLRDERLVQRYLVAVESGQAYGWNAIVYGITLAVFSLPLRQGLLFYSQEILSAVALAGGLSAHLSDSEWASKLSVLLDRLPAGVEAALAGDGGCVSSALHPGELAPGV